MDSIDDVPMDTAKRASGRWWLLPLWPAVVTWVLLTLVHYFYLRWSIRNADPLGLVEGFTGGLIGLAVILTGLTGRNWMIGWLIGIVLSAVGLITFVFAYDDALADAKPMYVLWLLPLICLSACLPFTAARNLWGWSFTLEDEPELPRTRTSVEDIFLMSIAVAASLTLCYFPQQFWGKLPPWFAVVIMAYGFFLSLVAGLPVAFITFRIHRWPLRIAAWLAAGIVAIFVCLTIEWAASGSPFGLSFDFLSRMLTTMTATLAIGLTALLCSGVKLTRFARRAVLNTESASPETQPHPQLHPHPLDASTHPLDEEPGLAAALDANRPSWDRRFMRCVTAGVCLIAVGVVVAQLLIQSSRQSHWQQVAHLTSDPKRHVSEVWAPDGVVREITVTPEFNDWDLEELVSQFPQLERLNLAGSKITGDSMPNLSQLDSLTHLDLSNTALTDEDLRLLVLRHPLYSLSVAGTKTTLRGVMEWTERETVRTVDAGRLGITDQQLKDVKKPSMLRGLGLSGNPITDAGLQALNGFLNLAAVDLSETAIDGSGLAAITNTSLRKWNFDGTQITDQHLVALLTQHAPNSISIQRTAITAAALPTIAAMGLSLTLGDGLIVDQDLTALSAATFSCLCLHGSNFTGACLASGRIQTQYLDLSGSQVTDAEVNGFRRMGFLIGLNLSHTRVTPDCLKANLAHEVIYYGNRVSAAELLPGAATFSRTYLRSQDFTQAENAQLQEYVNVIFIDVRSTEWPE